MEVIDSLFELLDLPPIFSGVFQRTSNTSTNFLYSTKLQRDLEKAFNDTLDINNETFQISGIETHELFLKYPQSSYIASAIENSRLFVSRLEYARRLLYHLNNLVPDCNNILSYIVYLESLYSQISGSFEIEEIKKSEKRIEDLLKKYQKNYYLYIMYTEHVLLKQGKIERAKKVFENLLKFVTKKKDVFILYYFYINMYVRKDMNTLNKSHQNDLMKLLWRFTCYLQGTKYVEGDVTPMQIIQIQKTITKFMSEALLKPITSKPKRVRLYFMTKICPLSKVAILIYFSFICSSLLTQQEVESTIKEYRDNMNVLNLKIAEKLQKNVELERVVYIKKNNQSLIDLMNFAVHRLLVYRKHSSTFVNPQVVKRFAIENTKMNPKNFTLAIETIKAIYNTSLRTNQLFKLKTSLDLKVIETPYWYIVISEELRRYSGDEKEKLQNLLKSYFQEFNKEETLYDQLFSEMEKRYRKKETPDWEDCSYLQENYMYINDQFGKLYLRFISLFFPQDLKREALISLHRFPFSKDKYLSYLIPSLSDESEIKKIFTMLFEKEIRTYKEYNV